MLRGTCLAVACLIALALAWHASSQQPDLRQQINELIADASRTPTNAGNARARAEILDEWANQASLQGIVIPPELPENLATLKGGRRPEAGGLDRSIDWFIEEINLKENHPNGLGVIRIGSLGGPLTVDTYATVEVVYTVGDIPIRSGGGLRIGVQRNSGHGAPQAKDRAAPNFVTFRCSNPGVRLRIGESAFSGLNGNQRGGGWPAVYLEQGMLQKGDTIIVTLGDRSGGSPGFKVQNVANDRFILPVYVDFEGKGNFLYMRNPGLEVTGGAAERLSIVAPSIVDVGEKFRVRLRIEDRFWNPAGDSAPPIDVLLDGKPLRSVARPGSSAFSVDDVALDSEGVHYFAAKSKDGRLEAESNPVLVKRSPKSRIFWGETHGHTGVTDGQGTEDGYFRYARDFAYLDFCALSEHDVWLTSLTWRAISEATKKYHEPGRFVTFKSYEWTANWQSGGHHNVFFRRDDGIPAALRDGASEIKSFYRLLRQRNDPADVLVVPHCHNSGTWLVTDPDLQSLVEIYAFHGSFEYYGQRFLDRGERVGLIAAGDNHQAHPGYSAAVGSTRGGLAAVMAPSRNRDAIFDAMKSRSTYATSGERILIDFELNGQPMGSMLPAAASRDLRVRVAGTGPLDKIDVIKNSRPVYSRDYAAGTASQKVRAQVMFRSASNNAGKEFTPPRAMRPWNGTLRVNGARLVSASGLGLDRLRSDVFQVSGNEVVFHFQTRGDSDGLMLSLEGVSASTSLSIHLDEDRETGPNAGSPNAHRALPARDLAFPFQSLKGGRLSHEVGDADYSDTVSLQTIQARTSREGDFTYRDVDSLQDGDYYYVRVTQLDGEMAWSSPIWVGKGKSGPVGVSPR